MATHTAHRWVGAYTRLTLGLIQQQKGRSQVENRHICTGTNLPSVTVFDTSYRLCLFRTTSPRNAGMIPRQHKAHREGSYFAGGSERRKKKRLLCLGPHDGSNFPVIWLCGWLCSPCFINCFCRNVRFILAPSDFDSAPILRRIFADIFVN